MAIDEHLALDFTTCTITANKLRPCLHNRALVFICKQEATMSAMFTSYTARGDGKGLHVMVLTWQANLINLHNLTSFTEACPMRVIKSLC